MSQCGLGSSSLYDTLLSQHFNILAAAKAKLLVISHLILLSLSKLNLLGRYKTKTRQDIPLYVTHSNFDLPVPLPAAAVLYQPSDTIYVPNQNHYFYIFYH